MSQCNVATCYNALSEPLLAFQYAEECLQLDRTQVRAHFVCFCSLLERNDHVAGALIFFIITYLVLFLLVLSYLTNNGAW